MTAFLARRLAQSALLLLGITIISYGIMRAAPGGPVAFLENPRLTAADREAVARSFGLHEPVPLQYGKWLWNLLRFDFGYSLVDGRSVLEKITERVPATFQLSLASFLLGLLGIPLGVFAALHRGRLIDNAIRVFTVVLNAVPHWWLGLMILVISASTVRIFPLGGMYTIGADNLLDRLWHLALPATIGAMSGWIVFSRFVRTGVLDVLGQDYVRTARAKGLPRRAILTRHVLRNALAPVITLLGSSLVGLFSGAVLFETTFSWPGMGRMAVAAAFQRDYPVLMGLTVIFSFLVILGNLLADLAYGFVDPRVRYD